MGQTESAAHPRRVDPRWARVALEQLRDEEFLSKQLRRQETIAGARQAAASGAGRRQRRGVGLFADGSSHARDRPVWTRILKQKTANGDEDSENDMASKMERAMTAEQRARVEEAREDELLHALVLLAELPQPTRAAYLLCHLQDQVARHAAVPDPVAELVALREQILRDVYEAVDVQHQHYRAALAVHQSAVEKVRNAIEAMNEKNEKQRAHDGAVESVAAVEASFATDCVVEIVGGLLEAAPIESAQDRRELLREMAALVETLPPLSLAPTRPSSTVQHSGIVDTKGRRVVKKLQQFLLDIATGSAASVGNAKAERLMGDRGDISPRARSLLASDYDVADRTTALTALVHLSAATAAVEDFLGVVSVLLGVGMGGDTDDKSREAHRARLVAECPSPEALVASNSLASSPVPTTSRQKDFFYLKEFQEDDVPVDERLDPSDEMATYAVEQRLRQVHKQRVDHGVKVEIDGQTTTVDQLLAGGTKRKATKSLIATQTKAITASAGVSSGSVANRLSIPQVPTAQAYSLNGRHTVKGPKDDFNNVAGDVGLGFLLDFTSIRNESGTYSSRHEALTSGIAVQCPKFQLLNVGAVLKGLDEIKPTPPTRQSTLRFQHGNLDPTVGIPANHDRESMEDDREVWSCGQNSYGELGHGDTTTRKAFERIDALQHKDIVQVCAGNEHSIVLSADGTVWTCGYNDNGQCGHGVTTRINQLTELQKLIDSPIAQVHAYNGCEHTILVSRDGRAATFGYNYRGQLGHGNTQSETMPKIVRSLEGKQVRMVSCSYYHTILTCETGVSGQSLVYTFGRNDYGQLGHGDSIDRKAPQHIEALQDHQVVSVACGQYHTVAVTSAGKVFAFGKNDYGQLGVDTIENQLLPVLIKCSIERQVALEVRCGYYHTILLTAGSHLYGFGRNDYGQLGLGKASNSSTLNIQLQQQRFAFPQLIEDLEGKEIVRFACGCYHTMAVSDNGVLYVFGRNNHGQLGTGDTNERLYPYPIDDFVGKRVAMVAAGFYHTLVLTGGRDDEGDEAENQERGGQAGDRGAASDVAEDVHPANPMTLISSSAILSSSAVKDILDGKPQSSGLLTVPQRPKPRDSSETADPTSDVDGEDGRTEDGHRRAQSVCIGENIFDLNPRSPRAAKLSTSPSKTIKSESVDIAVIILAQLDRLCKPHLPKKSGLFVSSAQLSLSAMEKVFVGSTELDMSTAVFFEPYVLSISAATFSSLHRLVSHLSFRRIDALNSGTSLGGGLLSTTGVARKAGTSPGTSSGVLQAYLLGVCLRLLQANVDQLLRSGLYSTIKAYRQACSFSSEANPPQLATDEIKDICESLTHVRHVLCCLLDQTKQAGASSVDVELNSALVNARVASEALDTLMLGLEVFFPCRCSKLTLLKRVVGHEGEEEVPTKTKCPECLAIDWAFVGAKKLGTKRFLFAPMLKRLSDDAIVVQFLPFHTADQIDSEPLEEIHCITNCLLERLDGDFIRTLGSIAADRMASDTQLHAPTLQTPSSASPSPSTAAAAMIAILNTLQKHLASWATSCTEWKSSFKQGCTPSGLADGLCGVIVHTFCNTSDRSQPSDDLPLAWRGLLEFSCSVISRAYDLLVQVASRSTPSPTARKRNTPDKEDLFSDINFHDRISSALARSIVGQLLPALVDGLLSFAHLPAFAAALAEPAMLLLRMIGDWNTTNSVVQKLSEEDRIGKVLSPTASHLATRNRSENLLLNRSKNPSALIASRSEKGANSTTSRLPVSEALALPWSLLLEKELALLCARLVSTVVNGNPMIQFGPRRQSKAVNAIDEWARSELFRGGLMPDFIHRSLFEDATESIITHGPRVSAVKAAAPCWSEFRLVLPSRELEIDAPAYDVKPDALTAQVLQNLSRAHVRAFIFAMAQPTMGVHDTEQHRLSRTLCEWIRASYSTSDSAYRMLLRQAQMHRQHQQNNGCSSEVDLEAAFFAVLVHHYSYGLLALLISLREPPLNPDHHPPRSFLNLWRVVAEFRKRLLAKRTAIKNAATDVDSAKAAVEQFQRMVLDRCQLLLHVQVADEEQHRLCLLDGGFIAPWDPAFLYSACLSSKHVGQSKPLRAHMAACYGDACDQPFLVAYPGSRWRRVRTLFHVVLRWKAACLRDTSRTRADEAMRFILSEDAELQDTLLIVHRLLVDPCRRLSCSTRGLELLWELFQIPRAECVRISLFQELALALGRSRSYSRVSTAPYVYEETHRNALNDLIAAVTQSLVDKAQEMGRNPLMDDSAVMQTQFALLSLLRCLCQLHFAQVQYGFIADLGLVQVLSHLLLMSGDQATEHITAIEQNDSIRSITAPKSVTKEPHKSRLEAVLWLLLRSVVLHFGSCTPQPDGSPVVPIFPVTQSVFDTIITRFQELTRHGTSDRVVSTRPAQERLGNLGSSSNGTVRRSFEIIVGPRRFSPSKKGLTFPYVDMIQPSHGQLVAMSPLSKPNEFSITTWIYVAANGSLHRQDPKSPTSELAALEEKHVVFVRGDQHEISPYMVLSRDLESRWLLEVGLAVHVAATPSSSPKRLLWERLNSKEAIPSGRWTHVAIVLEGSKIRLYVNGILDSQRSLSSPLAVALSSSGSVDLDFCFGRHPNVALTGEEGNDTSKPYERASIAMEFVSALLSANAAASGKQLQGHLSKSKPVARSFDGLLSHFRFHNRALSPIHVRIVFDEKKPVKEDTSSTSPMENIVTESTQRLMQLHSLVRILVESDEGRVHLRQSIWTKQLWESAMNTDSPPLQLSSLRLLREILPFQSPEEVTHTTCQEHDQLSFIRLVLRIVGASLYVCDDNDESIMGNQLSKLLQRTVGLTLDQFGDSVELRNSTAERMLQRSVQRGAGLALVNELAALVADLATRKGCVEWRQHVWTELLRISEGDEDSFEWLGALYVLGGVVCEFTKGSSVEISGTRDQATLIGIESEEPNGSFMTAKHDTMATSKGIFVSMNGLHQELKAPASWYDEVESACECYRLRAKRNAPAPSRQSDHGDDVEPATFVRVHRDDLSSVPAALPLVLLAEHSSPEYTKLVDQLSSSFLTMPSSFPTISSSTGLSELRTWFRGSLVMRSMSRVASCVDGAMLLMRDERVVSKLVQIGATSDHKQRFTSLADVERKLWAVRKTLVRILADLEDQGPLEVTMWINSKRKVMEAASDASTQQESGEMFENGETTTQVKSGDPLDLKLDLDAEGNSPAVELSSRRSSGFSGSYQEDDDAEDENGVIQTAGGKVAMEDDTGGVAGGDDEEDGDDNEEDQDEEEDEEEDGEDEEDEEEAAEHRQEFVDELMMMGFPEEWCVLALKQTENDIVSASAWIVDNLEYLSRLQTSLDKQRDDNAEKSGFQAEEDDVGDDHDGSGIDPTGSDSALTVGCLRPVGEGTNTAHQPRSPARPDGSHQHFINDKEMGRKIFGEMYFPFEDGGYESNYRDQFFKRWREAGVQPTAPGGSADLTEDGTPQAAPEQSTPTESIEQFATQVEALDLFGLLEQLLSLERSFWIISSREVVVKLLASAPAAPTDTLSDMFKSTHFTNFLKFSVLRGQQFSVRQPDGSTEEQPPESFVRDALKHLLHAASNAESISKQLTEFSLLQIENAASNSDYETYLWTQRELTRADSTVAEEPAVELAVWTLDTVLRSPTCSLFATSESASEALQRLRCVLRSTNLPLKFLAITTMSRVLQTLRRRLLNDDSGREAFPNVVQECRLDFEGFLFAARNRFQREQVQHRALFSLYLQAYVEILHLLQALRGSDNRSGIDVQSLPPPIAVSCVAPPPTDLNTAPMHPRLVFDRKKCRSSLLQIADDGLSVAYSGNEMWKTVVMTRGFATGIHEWQIRVEKSTSSYLFIGVATRRANLDSFLGSDDQSWGFIGDKALYYQRNRLRVYGDSFTEGDCVGVHLNCELGTLAFSKNGTPLGVAFENVQDEVFPAVAFYSRHQKVSIVVPVLNGDNTIGSTDVGSTLSEGTIDEAVVVCEMMQSMSSKTALRPELLRSAFEMTRNWLSGSGRHVVTRSGCALWVNITKQACSPFGFLANDRVRTPRGNGRVLGVADNRLWVEVDGENGAWHMHPSRLRSMSLIIKPSSDLGIGAGGTEGGDKATAITDQPIDEREGTSDDGWTEDEFGALVQDKIWTLGMDRAILGLVNSHCDTASISPWNVPPDELPRIVLAKPQDLEQTAGISLHLETESGKASFTRRLLARFGFLRYFNAYFSRVVGFFDLTWHYFCPETALEPCSLLSMCRGSIFTSVKNDFFKALLDKTANAPKKADDDYDYPDDLTVMMINRPKAATAKCHPGTTKSLLLSMFGQSFEELHFLPLRALRMVYSHPMDDGQLRSFKVKFEGEGVDDYGGPYREFFSQFFTELQMIVSDGEAVESSSSAKGAEADREKALGGGFLPFLMPSPNWRNGVGSNREKFVLNGGLLGSKRVGRALVLESTTESTTKPVKTLLWTENPNIKKQLISEMCHFLGQMIGICLRTRVCVRLDLATCVWKALVGEEHGLLSDSAAKETATSSLKEVDFVTYTLLKTLGSLYDAYCRSSDPTHQAELDEELAAMDLSFTTYLSDGRLVELCRNGAETQVTMNNVVEYVDQVLTARTSEANDVVNVIKQGIHSIMPVAALGMLTWEELEKRVCGVGEMDIELLKQNTEYDEDLSPNDEFIQRFWRVLSAMEDEDKRAFLRFVWARSRLPVGTAQFHQKFKIQSLASSETTSNSSSADTQLPKSHTCFFALQLPRYSSDEVCRKQLLYAIHNCVEMDGDFRLADTEMTGWTEINPNDQLRF